MPSALVSSGKCSELHPLTHSGLFIGGLAIECGREKGLSAKIVDDLCVFFLRAQAYIGDDDLVAAFPVSSE